MYYRVDTKEVLKTQSDVRASFAAGDSVVLFAAAITDDDLAARGVFPMHYIIPKVAIGETADPSTVEYISGVWTQMWNIRPATDSEMEAAKPVVPQMVTRRQARQALAIKGVLGGVDTAINSLDDGTPEGAQRKLLAQIEWDDSLNFERSRPLLVQLGTALGLDSDGMDQLFIFAATL